MRLDSYLWFVAEQLRHLPDALVHWAGRENVLSSQPVIKLWRLSASSDRLTGTRLSFSMMRYGA